MASIGLYFAENDDELNVFYNKSFKDVFKTYLKYESELTKDAPVLIQEYILGQEYGLDVINDLDTNYVTTFAKKKISMRAGETDIGETVDPTVFLGIAKLLSKFMQHEGILSVDCLSNNNGIYVVEMNCRISGHYPISHLAGANVPKQLIKWLNKEPTDKNLLEIKEGTMVTKDLIPKIIKGLR